MLFDHISHMDCYPGLSQRIVRGLQLLNKDYSQTPPGRYAVEGDDLFYQIQDYDTIPDNCYESHKVYLDIQCVLSGQEYIAVHPVEKLTPAESAPEQDMYFYEQPAAGGRVLLTPGYCVLLWPQDGHSARIAVDAPQKVRKLVVKIRL